MGQVATALLRKFRDEFAKSHDPNSPVLINARHERLPIRQVQLMLKRYLALAELPMDLTPHKLRHTFASIADDLVSAATARAMLNHAGGDVAQVHYIGIGEAKLRAGWQTIADFIEAAR